MRKLILLILFILPILLSCSNPNTGMISVKVQWPEVKVPVPTETEEPVKEIVKESESKANLKINAGATLPEDSETILLVEIK